MSTHDGKDKGKEPVTDAPADGRDEWADEPQTNPDKSSPAGQSKRRTRRGTRGRGKNKKNMNEPEGEPASAPNTPAAAGSSADKSKPVEQPKPASTPGPGSAPPRAAAAGPSTGKNEAVGHPKREPVAGPSTGKKEPVGTPKPGSTPGPGSAPTRAAAAGPSTGKKEPVGTPKSGPTVGPGSAPTRAAAAGPGVGGNKPAASEAEDHGTWIGPSGIKWHKSPIGPHKLGSLFKGTPPLYPVKPQPDAAPAAAEAAPTTQPAPAPTTTQVTASGAQPPVAAPAPTPGVKSNPTTNTPKNPTTFPPREFPSPRRGRGARAGGQRGRGSGRPQPKVRPEGPPVPNPWGSDFLKKIQASDKVSNMSNAQMEMTPEVIDKFISKDIPAIAAAENDGSEKEPVTVEILEEKLENMKRMMAAQDEHVRGQATSLASLKKDNARMQYAGYEYEKKLKALAKLEEENAALREQNHDYEVELAGKQRIEEIHDAAVAETERLVEEHRRQLKVKDDHIAELEERNAGLESDLQASKNSLATVKGERLGLQHDLAKKNIEIVDLKAKVDQLEVESNAYSEAAQSLQKERDSLAKEITGSKVPAENEVLWSELRKAQEALDSVDTQLTDLESEQESQPRDETRVSSLEGSTAPPTTELEQTESRDEAAAPDTDKEPTVRPSPGQTGDEQSPIAPLSTEIEPIEIADEVPASEAIVEEPVVRPPSGQSDEEQRPAGTESEQQEEGGDQVSATEEPIVQTPPKQTGEEQSPTALRDTEFKQTKGSSHDVAALEEIADEVVVQPSPSPSDEKLHPTDSLDKEVEHQAVGGDGFAAPEKTQPSPRQSGKKRRASVPLGQRASSLPADLSRMRPTVSSSTQTTDEMPTVPVETEPEGSGRWRGFWIAVILVYVAFFLVKASRRDAQMIWGQANEVSRAAFVDLSQPSWIPFLWAEKLGYSLIVSQQLNQGMLG